MKKHVFILGFFLAMLQVAKPAQAQTVAKAQTAPTEIQALQPQADETKAQTTTTETQAGQPQTDETKAVAPEKTILTTKARGDGSGFESGDFLLSPKISVAPGVAISVDGEVSLNDMFAVGAYAGFGTEAGYGYYNTYGVRRNIFGFGGKFVFHATGVFNRGFGWNIPEKLDLFATGYIGARIASYTSDYSNYSNENTFYVTPGVTVGARYFFAPNIGVFAETGYNTFGSASVGMSFKF